jgi:hypothetical protein
MKILEKKTTINQIKNTVDNISSKQDQAEEKSEMEAMIEEIAHIDTIKKKK